MKKSLLLLPALLLISLMANAQLIKDRTGGKVTIGFDLFTDINTSDSYENFNLRSINQGFDTYITYNFPMAETKHTVSLGLGVSCHNYYMKNAWLSEPYNDVITFKEEPAVKKSKINLNYLDVPIEVNFRIADKFKISFGAKVSFLMQSKTKTKGDVFGDGHKWELKYKDITGLESIVYGVNARVGYRCVNVFVGYQLNNSFKSGKGPKILPFSIGIGIRAF